MAHWFESPSCPAPSAFCMLVYGGSEREIETVLLNPPFAALCGLDSHGFAASLPFEFLSVEEARIIDRHILRLLSDHRNTSFIDLATCQDFHSKDESGAFTLFQRWYKSAWADFLRAEFSALMASGRIKELVIWHKLLPKEEIMRQSFPSSISLRGRSFRIAVAEIFMGFEEVMAPEALPNYVMSPGVDELLGSIYTEMRLRRRGHHDPADLEAFMDTIATMSDVIDPQYFRGLNSHMADTLADIIEHGVAQGTTCQSTSPTQAAKAEYAV